MVANRTTQIAAANNFSRPPFSIVLSENPRKELHVAHFAQPIFTHPSSPDLMEPLPTHPLQPPLMNPISCSIRSAIFFRSSVFRCFCTSSLELKNTEVPVRRTKPRIGGKASGKVSDLRLKENWLDSLSYPVCGTRWETGDVYATSGESHWVIGVDPDAYGAVALLKPDDSGCSAQVFDSPHVKVLVGKRTRRRLNTKAMVELLRSFDAPIGTKAYVEQSIPYPRDGKQGWWSGGFGYGLWIGVLVASGFAVVPVPSLLWKNEFNLSGNGLNKDDSREVAGALFPSVSSLLRRKKDHGRAEALLIAAYGKGLKVSPNSSCTLEETGTTELSALS